MPHPGARAAMHPVDVQGAGLCSACSSAPDSTSMTASVRWPAGRCSTMAPIAGSPVSSPISSVQSAAVSVRQCGRGPPYPTVSARRRVARPARGVAVVAVQEDVDRDAATRAIERANREVARVLLRAAIREAPAAQRGQDDRVASGSRPDEREDLAGFLDRQFADPRAGQDDAPHVGGQVLGGDDLEEAHAQRERPDTGGPDGIVLRRREGLPVGDDASGVALDVGRLDDVVDGGDLGNAPAVAAGRIELCEHVRRPAVGGAAPRTRGHAG